VSAPERTALTVGFVPMTLSLNGNGITVSTALFEELRAAVPGEPFDRPVDARPLRAVVEARRRAGRPRPVLAHVHPVSTHHYLLRYRLATAGLEPGRDVDLVVVPPPQVPARLAAGAIDGCCVGEPWNQLAVRRGLGRVLTTTHHVWNNAAEKVLGVTADWADRHPRTLRALVRALVGACAWLDRLENRLEAARLVAQERYVAAPLEAVAHPLLGYVQHAPDAVPWHVPDACVFHRHAADFPWASHALWYGAQTHRAGQLGTRPRAAGSSRPTAAPASSRSPPGPPPRPRAPTSRSSSTPAATATSGTP
jgi:two-component system, oxyanion-binding sensor